jgi:perosamine synthetase
MKVMINQMQPWFGAEERQALNDYMQEGGWVTEFRKTQEFEQMICDYTDAKHCFAVNNGTISLTLAAMACGIKAGDEVIVPNYTMIASPNSVKMFGATPVFVDVEPETLCLDIKKVEQAITDKTKAIMLVSANGRYPNSGIQIFQNLCATHSIKLIEDSAQALGSFYPDGRHIGTVGAVGSFSFSAPKVISTGQGGAIITNDDKIAEKISRLKDFGRSGGGNDIHESIGYNFKFTDIQAVIGIEQMKKLAWRVDRKKEIWKQYREQLTKVSQIKLFDQDIIQTSPWFIDSLVEDRQNLQQYLKAKGVGTRVMYPPINEQKAYKTPGEHPVSKQVGEQGLWFPSASQLSDAEIGYICSAVTKFYSL